MNSAAPSLRALRAQYGKTAEAAKRQALAASAVRPLRTLRALLDYHEDLLFLLAFPGARATRRAAAAELALFARRWRALPAAARVQAANRGIAGTVTRPSLAWPLAAWLVPREDIEIDWPQVDSPADLDALVAARILPAERDAWDSGEYSARAWMALAAAGTRAAVWLVQTAPARSAATAAAWDAAAVPLRWNLGDSSHAVTHARLPLRTPVLRQSMRRPTEPAPQHIARRLDAIERLGRRQAAGVVALARAALAARAREVHAMNYPNLDEVYRCDLGEGVDLALFGVLPSQRLTLEANYGYLLISNGVPIGYGGVSPLYRQANTGINIFDPFRGGEAAFLWLQTLRAFRTLFGTRRFIVNGYQFGAGNSEAIASGAYWFYYRLGFRPSRADNARLAAREAERLRRAPTVRSGATLLRQLARGDLHLDLDDVAAGDHFEESLLPRIGAALARQRVADGTLSPAAAEKQLTHLAAAQLGVSPIDGSGAVKAWFRRLAPLVALLDVAGWPADERRALGAWLLAKGAPQERGFAQLAAAQTRFFNVLRSRTRAEAEQHRGR